MKPLLLVSGWAMLGIGLVGTIMPILPATPFFLAAAWLFSRSSPRLQLWLHGLPAIGASLRLWQEHGAIGLRAKFTAVAGIALGAWLLLQVAALPAALTWALLVVMLAVVAFIVTRPGRPGRPVR